MAMAECMGAHLRSDKVNLWDDAGDAHMHCLPPAQARKKKSHYLNSTFGNLIQKKRRSHLRGDRVDLWDDVGDSHGGLGHGPAALAQEGDHVIGGGDLTVVQHVGHALLVVDSQGHDVHRPLDLPHGRPEVAPVRLYCHPQASLDLRAVNHIVAPLSVGAKFLPFPGPLVCRFHITVLASDEGRPVGMLPAPMNL